MTAERLERHKPLILTLARVSEVASVEAAPTGAVTFVTGGATAAISLADLRGLPSNRLEALRGDRAGQYSIRINQQWRICFEWQAEAPGPSNVEIVDYH